MSENQVHTGRQTFLTGSSVKVMDSNQPGTTDYLKASAFSFAAFSSPLCRALLFRLDVARFAMPSYSGHQALH
jgi:hypothetical protein